MSTKQTEALKLALEALEVATTPLAKDRQEVLRAITAIRVALAEQPAHGAAVNMSSERVEKQAQKVHEQPAQQQEPVAWATRMDFFNKLDKHQDELRRLHEENQSLNKCLFQMQEAAKKLENQLGEAVWNYGEKVRANQELLDSFAEILAVKFSNWSDGEMREIARAAIAKATGENT